MFAFDQIAVRAHSIDSSVEEFSRLGHKVWVRDTVEAVHLYGHPAFALGQDFRVHLAFNYEVFPGQEFELIQLVDGKTAQLLHRVEATGISHFGYHVLDPKDHPDGVDTLVAELKRLQYLGMNIAQVSQTVNHAGTNGRYRYAFVFFDKMGAPIKIIQRLTSSMTVEQGMEAYAWLSSSH